MSEAIFRVEARCQLLASTLSLNPNVKAILLLSVKQRKALDLKINSRTESTYSRLFAPVKRL